MVVEQDVSVVSSVVDLIQGWGYRAEASSTGQDTLRRVGEKRFDLVLIDISPPDMSAQELIERLKELRPEIGIVTMTGQSTDELEKEIRTLGIIYYMSKPINESALKEILDHISRKKDREATREGGFRDF
jgi:two-component system response regulator PilR (NtrC family)